MGAIPWLRGAWRRAGHELRRRFRRPLEGRFQPYGYTLPDRYPWLFGFAREVLQEVAAPRLLSFGCSTGQEVVSLRCYLPDAVLKGVDIDARNIAACGAQPLLQGDPAMDFEVAADVAGEPSEAYDAAFCLAVLCHGDLATERAQRSEPLMRFDDFERIVTDLARCVKPGGYLFLHTTNYRFVDTAIAGAFDVVLEAKPEQMASDPHFDASNRLMPGERYLPVGFRKRASSR